MKMANVISVQDRDNSGTSNAAGSRIDRMSALLRRYPAIEDQERQELLDFLTRGAQEEIVQVTHLQGLEPRFLAFRADHPREFRAGLRGWLPMIVFVLVAILGLAWRLLS